MRATRSSCGWWPAGARLRSPRCGRGAALRSTGSSADPRRPGLGRGRRARGVRADLAEREKVRSTTRQRCRLDVHDRSQQRLEPREDPAPGPARNAARDVPGRRPGGSLLARDQPARLSDGERAALELAYFEDLTHSLVAQRLDVPLGTVKARIRRALGRLADFAEEGE